MEELQKIISDLEAEIRVLSVQAESAEDPADRKFYRRRLLMKEERLLKKDDEKKILLRLTEKKEDVLLKKEDVLLKKEDVLLKKEEVLLKKEDVLLKEKEKEVLIEKQKLLQLERRAGPQPNVDGTGGAGAATARTVSISSIKSQAWQGISKALELPISLVSTAPLTAAEVHGTEPFSWQPQSEASPINRKAAVGYLKRMVPPPAGQEWYDGAAKKTMLNCELPKAGIELKGSCDVALCTSAALKRNMPENGLRIVVELKKDKAAFNTHQLAVELLSANLRSPFLKPIAVMTDLMDEWCLMWTAEKRFETYTCEGRAEAIGILRAFLEQECLTANSADIMHQRDNGGPEAEAGGLLKRPSLLPASGVRADVADLDDLLDSDLGLSDTDLHQLRCASQLASLLQQESPRLRAAQDSWSAGEAAEAEAVEVRFPMMYS